MSRPTQTVTMGSLVAICLALSLLASGCATKKYVRNSLEPLEARLGKAEEQTSENARRITEVDQNAQQGIGEAKSQAQAASNEANQAGQQAQDAQKLAQKGVSEAERVRDELRNADNFKAILEETVQFGFDQSELTEEARQKLDLVASTVSSAKRYLIEVQGFTDRIGPEGYNLELSRRRAEAVVRYLTTKGKVPLARINEIGYGEEEPVAPNDSPEGRKQNRRVQIRVLAVQQAGSQGQQAQAAPPAQ